MIGPARTIIFLLFLTLLVIFFPGPLENVQSGTIQSPAKNPGIKIFQLPKITADGGISLDEALRKRRTVREYATGTLSLKALGKLLWSAQGITGKQNFRTAPSAGALYPLEIRVICGSISDPVKNELVMENTRDPRKDLVDAAFDQPWLETGAALIVISAIIERCAVKYGDKAMRYCLLEAGHTAQNILLQAAALDVQTGLVGAFDDYLVQRQVGLPIGELPMYLIPVGPDGRIR